jgi:hypothetical protein
MCHSISCFSFEEREREREKLEVESEKTANWIYFFFPLKKKVTVKITIYIMSKSLLSPRDLSALVTVLRVRKNDVVLKKKKIIFSTTVYTGNKEALGVCDKIVSCVNNKA